MLDPFIKHLLLNASINKKSSWAIVRNGAVSEFSITTDDKPKQYFDNIKNTLTIETNKAILQLKLDDSITPIIAENDKFVYPVGYSQEHFNNFNIDSIEDEQIIKYYDLISKLVKNKMIANALTWFNSFTREQNIQKKIIFLAIVIEILFTKEQEKDSLTHKISTRIAHLITKDYQSREKIYCNIKEFYDWRSLILHGENFEKLQKTKIGKNYFHNGGLESSYLYIKEAFKKYLKESNRFNSDSNFINEHNNFIKKLDLQ